MDASQNFLVDEYLSLSLSKLLDPSTTPVKALQLLQSHYHSTKVKQSGENKPVVIFLKYMRFIVTRLPDACVDGIWDGILRMTIMYSKDFAKDFCDSAKQMNRIRRIYASEVPANGLQEIQWLEKVLSDYNKCPNPYIRLELFRLIRVFQNDSVIMPWERLSATYIHTISEIQPHRLYPSGDIEEILCGALDFNYIIDKCNKTGHIDKLILVGFTDQFIQKHNMICESKEFRFIFHCLQLMGVFAFRISLTSNFETQEKQLLDICHLFFKANNFLKSKDLISGISPWSEFRYIISLPPFRHFVEEAICNITTAIINSKQSHKEKSIMAVCRDIIAWDLDVYSKPCDLPKLLFSRQVHGSMLISKYSLLIRDLRIFYLNRKIDRNSKDNRNEINIDYEDSDDEISYDEISYDEDSDNEDSDDEDSDDETNDEDIDDEEINDEEGNEEEI